MAYSLLSELTSCPKCGSDEGYELTTSVSSHVHELKPDSFVICISCKEKIAQ